MRLLLFAILLVAAPAQDGLRQDELLLRWNAFARDCNEYHNTVQVNPEKRRRLKERLNREWIAVYPLL